MPVTSVRRAAAFLSFVCRRCSTRRQVVQGASTRIGRPVCLGAFRFARSACHRRADRPPFRAARSGSLRPRKILYVIPCLSSRAHRTLVTGVQGAPASFVHRLLGPGGIASPEPTTPHAWSRRGGSALTRGPKKQGRSRSVWWTFRPGSHLFLGRPEPWARHLDHR